METTKKTEAKVPETKPAPKKKKASKPKVSFVKGTVANCLKLNVRTEPKKTADVVCEIGVGAEVKIDKANSSGDFYKVKLVSGKEGYCMKKFIALSE